MLLNVLLVSFVISGNVVKVNDGDTITLKNKNKYYKIRLAGIDAPELKQVCGDKSRQFLNSFIYKRKVYCRSINKDVYDRYVAICYYRNKNINKYMVENGWAIADYTSKKANYRKYDNINKKRKIGVYNKKLCPNFVKPRLFKKNNKN